MLPPSQPPPVSAIASRGEEKCLWSAREFVIYLTANPVRAARVLYIWFQTEFWKMM